MGKVKSKEQTFIVFERTLGWMGAHCQLPWGQLVPLLICIRLAAELAHVEGVIDPPLGHQAVMGATFDHPAILDDQHLVGVADGAQAMGDDKACPEPCPERSLP